MNQDCLLKKYETPHQIKFGGVFLLSRTCLPLCVMNPSKLVNC